MSELKILYAIQGTGNGHVTRAMEIVPHLQKRGKVDVLISGDQWDIELPFDVTYRFKGLCFYFGKKGGVDVMNTYLRMNSLRFLREIKSLPIEQYDLIISDFEPISCWAAYFAKKPCIGLSNQAVTLHPKSPRPKHIDLLGKLVLQHYAPVSANYGFHFKSFDENVYTPIIRKQVREQKITDKGHYTVYLPSYDDSRILKHLKRFKEIEWQVFTKHNNLKYKHCNIIVTPIENDAFIKSMASSHGVLCNAGFGTASEALFLGKKLMVIPMKTQYEQHCNAAVLKSMGVATMKSLKKKHYEKLEKWINHSQAIEVNYPDCTEKLIDTIITNHANESYRLPAGLLYA